MDSRRLPDYSADLRVSEYFYPVHEARIYTRSLSGTEHLIYTPTSFSMSLATPKSIQTAQHINSVIC